MTRLQYNVCYSYLDGALDNVDGSSIPILNILKEGGLNGTNIPSVASPDILVLVCEEEVMHVTAYTAGATALATVLRGQEETLAAAHPSGALIFNAPTKKDFVDTIQFSQPADGATRASTTLGALSTPWTDDITTTALRPSVKYDVVISCQCASNETLYAALTCDGTIIDRVQFIQGAGTNENRIQLSGIHTPSVGAHTYGVFLASNSGGSVAVNTSVDTSTTVSTTADGVSSMQLQPVVTA